MKLLTSNLVRVWVALGWQNVAENTYLVVKYNANECLNEIFNCCFFIFVWRLF